MALDRARCSGDGDPGFMEFGPRPGVRRCVPALRPHRPLVASYARRALRSRLHTGCRPPHGRAFRGLGRTLCDRRRVRDDAPWRLGFEMASSSQDNPCNARRPGHGGDTLSPDAAGHGIRRRWALERRPRRGAHEGRGFACRVWGGPLSGRLAHGRRLASALVRSQSAATARSMTWTIRSRVFAIETSGGASASMRRLSRAPLHSTRPDSRSAGLWFEFRRDAVRAAGQQPSSPGAGLSKHRAGRGTPVTVTSCAYLKDQPVRPAWEQAGGAGPARHRRQTCGAPFGAANASCGAARADRDSTSPQRAGSQAPRRRPLHAHMRQR